MKTKISARSLLVFVIREQIRVRFLDPLRSMVISSAERVRHVRYDSRFASGASSSRSPGIAAEPSSFRNIAISERGGSGSHGSITRKTGVSRFNNRIWARPNVLRRRIRPFNHQAITPVRLNFSTRSTLKSCGLPYFDELLFRIAAAMPEHFVQRPEKSRAIGNQHDGNAADLQDVRRYCATRPRSSARCSKTLRKITVSNDGSAGKRARVRGVE